MCNSGHTARQSILINYEYTDVTPDARVIATTRTQPEYNKPAGAYVTSIASATNVKEGLRKEAQWRPTFLASLNVARRACRHPWRAPPSRSSASSFRVTREKLDKYASVMFC
jgi:hypothetical protein